MATAATKSVLNESKQIERAAMLIKMGARMQVLESETSLSYERLIRLYKEIAGKSPQGTAAFFHRLVPDLAGEHPQLAVPEHL